MSSCKAGDQIECKVNDGAIVGAADKEYDLILKFEVASSYNCGFLIYSYAPLRREHLYFITENNHERYNVHSKFIGCNLVYITDYNVYSIVRQYDGESCDKCDEFYPMAARDENGKFKCYLCRVDPYRKC